MNALTRTLTAVAAAGLLTVGFAGCDEISTDSANFPINVTITLPQSIPIAMPDSSALDQITPDEDGTRVVPMCDGSQLTCIPVVHVDNADLLALDPTGTLEGYGDRIRAVEITGINSIVEENTLPVELRPIEIRIGNQGQDFEAAMLSGETQSYTAGETGTKAATMATENEEAIGEALGSFQFAVGLGTSLAVPDGTVGQSGTTNVEIQLELQVWIAPLAGL